MVDSYLLDPSLECGDPGEKPIKLREIRCLGVSVGEKESVASHRVFRSFLAESPNHLIRTSAMSTAQLRPAMLRSRLS